MLYNIKELIYIFKVYGFFFNDDLLKNFFDFYI